jgi:hypothetical protein
MDDENSMSAGFARRDREFAGFPVGPIAPPESALHEWHDIPGLVGEARRLRVSTGWIYQFWKQVAGGGMHEHDAWEPCGHVFVPDAQSIQR